MRPYWSAEERNVFYKRLGKMDVFLSVIAMGDMNTLLPDFHAVSTRILSGLYNPAIYSKASDRKAGSKCCAQLSTMELTSLM